MDIMGKVQGQYGCIVLAAPEMNPHCLTVLTPCTPMIIITIIMIISLMSILVWSMTTICMTTTEMLEFIVQVNNDFMVQIQLSCAYYIAISGSI